MDHLRHFASVGTVLITLICVMGFCIFGIVKSGINPIIGTIAIGVLCFLTRYALMNISGNKIISKEELKKVETSKKKALDLLKKLSNE
jgi:hypothetical protein